MSYSLEHNINDSVAVEITPDQFINRLLDGNSRTKGIDQQFIDSLERVPKVELIKKSGNEDCAICSVPFLEDPYPLVVYLPCSSQHRFDLECVAKWLKENGTCPICRHDFNKKSEKKPVPQDSEDEYDDMFG